MICCAKPTKPLQYKTKASFLSDLDQYEIYLFSLNLYDVRSLSIEI